MQNMQLEQFRREDISPSFVKLASYWNGSLAITECDVAFDLSRFLKFSTNILTAIARGTEDLPGQFLPPSRENVELPSDILHSLAEWYSYLYGRPFRSPYGLPQPESTAIEPRVKQYARLQLGDETFGSMMSHRY